MTAFRKSSFCEPTDGWACVEVAIDPSATGATSVATVRNTTSPDKQIGFSRDEWLAFVAGVKNGEFDI